MINYVNNRLNNVTSYEDNITSSHNITNNHFYNSKDYDFMYLFS